MNDPFFGHQQQQSVNTYSSNPYQLQSNPNNALSDDLSPSSIASQITNMISNQSPSSSTPNWFEQLGQFGQNFQQSFSDIGQNVGQQFQNFGQNIGNGFNNAWQQVNQFGQNAGNSFSSFFNPQNSRQYGVLPLGFRNVPGVQRQLDVEKESSEGQFRISPLTKEADWYKSSVSNKRADVKSKIPAEYDAPVEYHH